MIVEPHTGKVHILHNPKSGSEESRHRFEDFCGYLKEKEIRFEVLETESIEHSRELIQQSSDDPDCSLLMISGGDGTIRESLATVYKISSKKPVFLLPNGTMNLMAKELGYGMTAEKWQEIFEDGVEIDVDLGRVNDEYICGVVGIGLDSSVVKKMDEQRSGHISKFSYFWPIWKTFWKYKFPKIKVENKGSTIFHDSGQILIGNITRYGVSMEVISEADYTDGKLDICIFCSRNRFSMIFMALLAFFKLHTRWPSLVYEQGEKIKVSCKSEMKSEIDGDPGLDLPLDIEVIPKAVRVLVPKEDPVLPLGMKFIRKLETALLN